MATFRAASLVSVTEVEKLVARLAEQQQVAESQRAQLAMRLSANNRDEETQRLLAQTELGLRDVKTALRELSGEKDKLVAARGAAKDAKEADRKRRAPAPATAPGTKLGKFTVPTWISGRAPMLLEASKDGKALQTTDLAKRDCFILGRQPELCHVTLEHASVSRQHVAILHGAPPGATEPGWFLVDLGSAHGTGASAPGQPLGRVKGEVPFALVPGASFRIGKSSRVYTVKEDARRARGSKPAPTVPERPRAAGSDDDDDDDDDEDDDMMHPDDRPAEAAPTKRKREDPAPAPEAPRRGAPPAPAAAPAAAAAASDPTPAAAAPKWTAAEVNKMTVPKLKAALTELGLETSGLKAVLKERLLGAINAA